MTLIDCDIHVGYETLLDLAPYLDPATRELVVNCGTNGLGMPSYPWYHPTGWLFEQWLEPEPRLRGLVVVSAQHPEAAAAEIRRVGGRDEFVGVFLPGAARIPYGSPVHDPLWRACDDLGLPVAVHTHFEGVGIAGPVTGAGMPDFYTEYHALTGAGMFGHFASILCHGVFERFPRTRVIFMEGGLVPFVGLLWRLDTAWRGCRTEVPQ